MVAHYSTVFIIPYLSIYFSFIYHHIILQIYIFSFIYIYYLSMAAYHITMFLYHLYSYIIFLIHITYSHIIHTYFSCIHIHIISYTSIISVWSCTKSPYFIPYHILIHIPYSSYISHILILLIHIPFTYIFITQYGRVPYHHISYCIMFSYIFHFSMSHIVMFLIHTFNMVLTHVSFHICHIFLIHMS